MSSSDIYPFCFYQYRDESTNTYRSYLSPSKDTISCPNLGNGWKKEGSIYCINPSLPAKPNGLKNLAVLQSKGDRNIVNIEVIDNIFSPIYNNSINTTTTIITAWLYPVPNSTPLYLHVIENNIFLSWNPLPPPDDKNNPDYIVSKGLSKEKGSIKSTKNTNIQTIGLLISPIYVLSKDVFGEDFKNIKFQCVNNNIIPYTKDIPNLFSVNKIEKPLPINQAILKCNQNNKPLELLDLINNLSQTKNKTTISPTKTIRKINPILVSIIISVFLLMVILLIYFTVR